MQRMLFAGKPLYPGGVQGASQPLWLRQTQTQPPQGLTHIPTARIKAKYRTTTTMSATPKAAAGFSGRPGSSVVAVVPWLMAVSKLMIFSLTLDLNAHWPSLIPL